MNIRFLYIHLFLCYLLVFQTNNAFAQQYYFNHLTAEDGLSSNVIKCINKDSHGYLWVGCDNALNRYDGSKFVRYVHNPSDSTSITGGAIQSILEDHNGRLWISTKNGVCFFNYKTEKFTKVLDAEAENTFGGVFYVSMKNELFLCTPKGLYLLNKTTNQFIKLV